MERMLVVVFDNETKAYEGKSALRRLEQEGSVTVYADAVVIKHANGTTSVKQYDDFGPVGTLVGTSVGSLIGLLGGPVGFAVGAASGLALGMANDLDNARVGEDFVDDVAKTLTPNKVAVIAEIEEDWTTPVDTQMETLGGTVLRRSLWEVREHLREEEIAAMKADLAQLKDEMSKAHADRRAKLQKKVDHLQAKIEARQQKAKERLGAIQAHQKSKRELLKKNAAAAGQALKVLAKTPL
jgi:uncharacterized membrane protein